MDLTYYTFSFYVFLLACALIWFYGRVIRKAKKEDKSSYEKEQRLFKMYQNVEDMLNMFEEYSESAKSEISKSLEQARSLIENTKKPPEKRDKPVEHISVPASVPPETSGVTEIIKENKKPAKSPEKSNDMKAGDMIPLLLSRGMNKSEIAKELGLSVREVSLILDIKKIRTDGN